MTLRPLFALARGTKRNRRSATREHKALNVPKGTHSEEEILGIIQAIRRQGLDPGFYFLGEAEGRFFRGRKLRKLYC